MTERCSILTCDDRAHRVYPLIGVGIAVDANTGKHAVTTHYATESTSKPLPVCH